MSILKLLDFSPAKPSSAPPDRMDISVLIPFNSHQNGMPAGTSNNHIASKAKAVESETLGTIAQWEFQDTDPVPRITHVLGQRGRDHIKTREFLRSVEGLYPGRTLRIFAHSDHAKRCQWMAEKLGFTVKLGDCSDSPYDKTGTQWWCRNRPTFLIWEFFTRVHHLFKGWV